MKVEQTAEDEGKIIQQVNPGDSNTSVEIKQCDSAINECIYCPKAIWLQVWMIKTGEWVDNGMRWRAWQRCVINVFVCFTQKSHVIFNVHSWDWHSFNISAEHHFHWAFVEKEQNWLLLFYFRTDLHQNLSNSSNLGEPKTALRLWDYSSILNKLWGFIRPRSQLRYIQQGNQFMSLT